MLPVNVYAAVMALTRSPIVIQFGYVLFRAMITFKRFCQHQPQSTEGFFDISMYFSDFRIQQSNS